MRQILISIILSIFKIVLLIIPSIQFDQIPPPGKFSDPIIGFWQDDVPDHQHLSSTELKNEIEIINLKEPFYGKSKGAFCYY